MQFIERHKLLFGFLAAVIVGAPQWISSVWSLFSSDPIVPWLEGHYGFHLGFSPWLISVPAGVVMFGFVVWAELFHKMPIVSEAQRKRLIKIRNRLLEEERRQPPTQED